MTNAIAIDRPTPVTVSDIRGLPTVNVDVAAAFLGISRNAAYAAVKAGEIVALKLGRRVVIPVHPLLTMVGADAELETQVHSPAA